MTNFGWEHSINSKILFFFLKDKRNKNFIKNFILIHTVYKIFCPRKLLVFSRTQFGILDRDRRTARSGPIGPNWSEILKKKWILVRSEIWKALLVPVRFGPRIHFVAVPSPIRDFENCFSPSFPDFRNFALRTYQKILKF